MTGDKSLVADLDESVKTKVKLGTDNIVSVVGKGVVNILTKQGQQRSITDVLYAPSLKHNLISVGQLTKKGYNVIFKGT